MLSIGSDSCSGAQWKINGNWQAPATPRLHLFQVGSFSGGTLPLTIDVSDGFSLPYSVHVVGVPVGQQPPSSAQVRLGVGHDGTQAPIEFDLPINGDGTVSVTVSDPASGRYDFHATVEDAAGNQWAGIASDTDVLLDSVRDVFLFIGQSNMRGLAAFDGGADYPAGTLQVARGGGVAGASEGALVAAAEPLDHVGAVAGTMGVGLQFAVDYEAANPDRELVIIPNAQGETGLANGNWNKGDALYENAISRTNAFFAAHPNDALNGIIVHGGEADFQNTASYMAGVMQMIEDLRADITVATSSTPIVFGGVSHDRSAYDPINGLIEQIPQNIPHVGFASSVGVTTGADNIHFDAAGARTLGGRYLPALLDAASNVPSAPGAPQNVIATPGDTTVTLAWDTLTDTGHHPITSFSVEVSSDGGAFWSTATTSSPDSTSSLITGLSNDTAYQFRLIATNQIGNGPTSSVVAATPIGASGAAITSYVLSQTDANQSQYTFTPVTGAGDAIIICNHRGSGTKSVNGVSVGGNAATLIGTVPYTNAQEGSAWYVTGLTAGAQTVVVDIAGGASGRMSAAVATITGGDVSSAIMSGESGQSDTNLSATLPVEGGGVIVAVHYQAIAPTGADFSGFDTTMPWEHPGDNYGAAIAHTGITADDVAYPVNFDSPNGTHKVFLAIHVPSA